MSQMDVQIMNLDDAYENINRLSREINKSQNKVLEELERIINNIKMHWKGSDASNHINSLIDEYDKYTSFFSELGTMTSYISDYFVLLQRTRAKISNASKVGEVEDIKTDVKKITKMEDTSEYFYDPALQNDYNDISELSNYYSNFIDKTDQQIIDLLNNWKEGKGRTEIKEYFNSFWIVSNRISSRINDLKNQMAKVIANASMYDD